MRHAIVALLISAALLAAGYVAGESPRSPESTKEQRDTVVVDAHAGRRIASLMASTEGSASIDMSSGGAVIGGGAHENVHTAALAFVGEVVKHKIGLQQTPERRSPAADKIRFYLRTREGVFVVEVPEPQLADGAAVARKALSVYGSVVGLQN